MRFIRYFLIAVPFLIAGIVYSREVPKIKIWLLNKIQLVSREKADLEIKAKEINFRFYPPGVELKGITLAPLKEMASRISVTTIDSVGISLSPASLIAGRFEIGSINIDHPVTYLFFRKKTDEHETKGANGGDTFDQAINIPIKEISVKHGEIRAKFEAADLAVQLKDFGFQLDKSYRAVKADVFAPNVLMVKTGIDGAVSLGLATRIILEKNAVEIAALKATQGENFIIAGGVARGEILKGEFPFINGRTLAHLDLKQTGLLAKLFFPSLKFPAASGQVDFEILAKQERGKDPRFGGEITTKNVQIDKFKIGNVRTKMSYAQNILSAKEIDLQNEAGDIKIQDFELRNGKEMKVSARAKVEKVELKQLLDNIDIQVPLHMDLTGNIPCEGTLTPPVRLECAGEVTGTDFLLYSKIKHKTIVALKGFKLAATMIADSGKISFPKGILSVGTSQGVASGTVDFEKGFNFYYHTDRLDFNDVQSLAELKFDGALAVTGTTSGTGHTGVMDAQVSSPNFTFENYGLGSFNSGLHYVAGFIKLTDVHGQNGGTQYNGAVNVLVDDDGGDHQVGIKSAKLDIPQLYLNDVPAIFGKKMKFPFDLSGSGSAQITASGPFSLSKLSYSIKGATHHGVIAGESYQDAHFDLHGVQGHAYADDISFKRGDGLIRLTGDVLPTGMMNVDVKGQNLRLGDSEHARTLASGLDGRINFDMTMKDFILTPQTFLKATLTQTTLNQQILDDSSFDIGFSNKNMTLNGQLFAKKLSTHLVYPFRENEPFAFNFETTNWDFTSFLGVTGKNSGTKDYEASLSAKVDLSSKEGSFWKSRGSAVISRLYVRHGTSQMKNVDPLDVRFDDGNITVNKFKVEGDNTNLVVTGGKNKKDALNMSINGRMDLALLTFLTPFFRDMTGEISLSTQVGGTLTHPDLLGSAFLKKGYFKLEALPQAFENISADLLFSQQRVLVNRLAGNMGGGNLTAGGGITFHSFGDIPVELTGDLTGATFTVPDGLTTHGDFHFAISGSWFPYVLKGEYNIDNGVYAKNFEDENSGVDVKRSAFLPKLLLQREFFPIELDLSTHFHKGIAVKNSTMTGDIKGDLEVKGDPAHAVLKGDLEAVPGGKIYFNETPFTITECRVNFRNITDNNPTIYTLATAHVRDWDVTLLLQGTKTKYKLELTSSPPLPEKSIISLLALGVTEEDELRTTQKQVFPTYGTNNPGGAAQAPTTDVGATNTAQAASLLLQKVELRNELKRKWGINVRLSNTVDETRNLVMPTVTAEKEWTPQVNTSVSRTMGVYVTEDVRTEYKLNRNFSLVGSYEGRDSDYLTAPNTTGTTSSNLPLDIFGLDLQYQMEFR